MNNVKHAIDTQYATIDITPELRESILQNTVARNVMKTQKTTVRPMRFRLAAAIAICLGALLLAVPVLGAVSRTFNGIIADYFSQDLAQMLMPLDAIASLEVEGIRYDVISAIADEYDIFLELEIKDVSGESRLEEGFWINGGPITSSSGYHTMISINPTTCRMYQYYSTSTPVDHNDVTLFINGISWHNGNRIGVYEYEHEGNPYEYEPLLMSFRAEKALSKQLEPVTAGSAQYYDISISPFALHLQSNVDIVYDRSFCIEVYMNDGQTYTFNWPQEGEKHGFSSSTLANSSYYQNSIFFGQLLDITSIDSISINGEIITLA